MSTGAKHCETLSNEIARHLAVPCVSAGQRSVTNVFRRTGRLTNTQVKDEVSGRAGSNRESRPDRVPLWYRPASGRGRGSREYDVRIGPSRKQTLAGRLTLLSAGALAAILLGVGGARARHRSRRPSTRWGATRLTSPPASASSRSPRDGGSGGIGEGDGVAAGGAGATVIGRVAVTQGTALSVFVGGVGAAGNSGHAGRGRRRRWWWERRRLGECSSRRRRWWRFGRDQLYRFAAGRRGRRWWRRWEQQLGYGWIRWHARRGRWQRWRCRRGHRRLEQR